MTSREEADEILASLAKSVMFGDLKSEAARVLLLAVERVLISMHDDALADHDNAITPAAATHSGTEAHDIAVFRAELSALRKRLPLGVK